MRYDNNAPLLMTPGPTEIHESVLKAASRAITNPDLDMHFFELYKKTTQNLKKIFKTKNDVLILSAEGILGLEAACASLMETGDRVLVIDNGIFGNGFGDFAKMYGADVTYYKADYEKAIDISALEHFLKTNHNFKVATLVHCETPSGITNPVDLICPLLKQYGILTVVDSVSALAGEKLETDLWQMDIVIGGSQKCLSAAPGLTVISISKDAYDMMESRKTPINSFYANLTIWSNWYDKKWFPYTQPISAIYQLDVAVERILADEKHLSRHANIAEITRKTFLKAGFSLYASSGYANTVTAVKVPVETTFQLLFNTLLDEHNIMIGGSIGYLKGNVFRIGHMGENCTEEKMLRTLKALDQVLNKLSVPVQASLYDIFKQNLI